MLCHTDAAALAVQRYIAHAGRIRISIRHWSTTTTKPQSCRIVVWVPPSRVHREIRVASPRAPPYSFTAPVTVTSLRGPQPRTSSHLRSPPGVDVELILCPLCHHQLLGLYQLTPCSEIRVYDSTFGYSTSNAAATIALLKITADLFQHAPYVGMVAGLVQEIIKIADVCTSRDVCLYSFIVLPLINRISKITKIDVRS